MEIKTMKKEQIEECTHDYGAGWTMKYTPFIQYWCSKCGEPHKNNVQEDNSKLNK